METDLLVSILIPFATTFLGGFAGWFFGRKRQKIDTIDAAVDTWQKIVNALEEQIAKLLEQRKEDGRKIEVLSGKINSLQGKVDELQNRLRLTEKLEKKVSRYEKLLTDNGIAY